MLFGIFMALLDIRLETVQKKIRMRVFFFFFFLLCFIDLQVRSCFISGILLTSLCLLSI